VLLAVALLLVCICQSGNESSDEPGAPEPSAQEQSVDEGERVEALPVPEAPAIVSDSISLIRLADPVAFLDGEARREVFLFYWDKLRSLRPGDGVRQGVAGISEINFAGKSSHANIRMFGDTYVLVEKIEPDRRFLTVHLFGRMLCRARGGEMILKLPRGNEMRAKNTVFSFGWDTMHINMVVQNVGPGTVALTGPIMPLNISTLEPGGKVEIPMNVSPEPPGRVTPTDRTHVWSGRVIGLGPGVESTKEGGAIVLSGEGTAWVGGARIVVRGRPITVRDPRSASSRAEH